MLPNPFLERMEELLGDEYPLFWDHYNQPPSIGLRVNTLKVSLTQFFAISPFPLSPLPWTESGFVLPVGLRPGKHPYHAAGLYYLQDPSAMAVAEILDPKPGEWVLDLAAAPGGKSTHIASKLEQEGTLVANDIHPRRVYDLAKNLERWGAQNVVVLNETPTRLANHFGAIFDKVLVDAPCSGEGMFRKDVESRQEWSPKFVASCAHRQVEILKDAARLVRPGGRLIYSTCTFSPEEDEGTIDRFIKEHPDFIWIDLTGFPGSSPGFSKTKDQVYPSEMAGTIRYWPHKTPGEGHFIAALQRSGSVSEPIPKPVKERPEYIPQDALSYVHEFMTSSLIWKPSFDQLAIRGSHVYWSSQAVARLKGLRVVHWGFWLGTLKTKRFEPSHALAMGLQPSDFQNNLSLAADDPRTVNYLHGEVLESPGPNGWVLVTVDGFPLGWGKRSNNRLKSHSPRWLRWI